MLRNSPTAAHTAGLIDNIVMIQAGDLIDSTIGVTLGLSTLTAAAYGQVVSDTAGTLFGNAIDAFFARLGLSPPNLSPAQRGLQRVRLVGTLSATAGVICGCLLGMTSLLLMDLEKGERCDGTRLGPLGPHACSPHPAPPTAA